MLFFAMSLCSLLQSIMKNSILKRETPPITPFQIGSVQFRIKKFTATCISGNHPDRQLPDQFIPYFHSAG